MSYHSDDCDADHVHARADGLDKMSYEWLLAEIDRLRPFEAALAKFVKAFEGKNGVALIQEMTEVYREARVLTEDCGAVKTRIVLGERCGACGRSDFVDSVDNHGNAYRGCAHCVLSLPTQTPTEIGQLRAQHARDAAEIAQLRSQLEQAKNDAARIEVRREDDAKMAERRDTDHAQTIEMCGASDARKDAEIAQLRKVLGEACDGWEELAGPSPYSPERQEELRRMGAVLDRDTIAALRARFGLEKKP